MNVAESNVKHAHDSVKWHAGGGPHETPTTAEVAEVFGAEDPGVGVDVGSGRDGGPADISRWQGLRNTPQDILENAATPPEEIPPREVVNGPVGETTRGCAEAGTAADDVEDDWPWGDAREPDVIAEGAEHFDPDDYDPPDWGSQTPQSSPEPDCASSQGVSRRTAAGSTPTINGHSQGHPIRLRTEITPGTGRPPRGPPRTADRPRAPPAQGGRLRPAVHGARQLGVGVPGPQGVAVQPVGRRGV